MSKPKHRIDFAFARSMGVIRDSTVLGRENGNEIGTSLYVRRPCDSFSKLPFTTVMNAGTVCTVKYQCIMHTGARLTNIDSTDSTRLVRLMMMITDNGEARSTSVDVPVCKICRAFFVCVDDTSSSISLVSKKKKDFFVFSDSFYLSFHRNARMQCIN